MRFVTRVRFQCHIPGEAMDDVIYNPHPDSVSVPRIRPVRKIELFHAKVLPLSNTFPQNERGRVRYIEHFHAKVLPLFNTAWAWSARSGHRAFEPPPGAATAARKLRSILARLWNDMVRWS
jgi:hypothetical protein